jgi:hypothetical protein
VGRSWHAEHVCSLNLTSISYSFWKKGQNVLKFYEKRAIHVKICLPCNFEVNSVTHFGVISLFSSNYQHFNTFRPLFQKLLEINVKFKLFISNSFWNKGRKVLKCWKFDEKREITPKWVTEFTSKLHGRQILTCWTCLQFKLNIYLLQHFITFRPLFQKLLEINVNFKLQTCSACQDLPTMQFW